MITTPGRKTILCYGDSNTYGQKSASYDRFAINERWTGILQNLLGSDFEVIEEGLGGRTVDIDELEREGRNGRTYFVPCLNSHLPLDLVIIMLGTNDLKVPANRNVAEIVDGIRKLVQIAQHKQVGVLLVAPAPLDASAPNWTFFGEGMMDETSAKKSRQLVTQLEKLAAELHCSYFAVGSVATTGSDGIHFDQASHQRLAEALTPVIKNLLQPINLL